MHSAVPSVVPSAVAVRFFTQTICNVKEMSAVWQKRQSRDIGGHGDCRTIARWWSEQGYRFLSNLVLLSLSTGDFVVSRFFLCLRLLECPSPLLYDGRMLYWWKAYCLHTCCRVEHTFRHLYRQTKSLPVLHRRYILICLFSVARSSFCMRVRLSTSVGSPFDPLPSLCSFEATLRWRIIS